MNRRARPTDLKALVAVQVVGGVINIAAGLTLAVLETAPIADYASRGLTGLGLLAGTILLSLGVASLVSCYGLTQLKPWAWNTALVIQISSIVISLLLLVLLRKPGVLRLAVASLALYYLMRPRIKAAFGR